MKTYRVYFKDGNQKLLEAENMITVLNYLVYELAFSAENITKVEEVN